MIVATNLLEKLKFRFTAGLKLGRKRRIILEQETGDSHTIALGLF